ncbi:type VII secretion protein EccE [Candidatus Mycolicibacterium alkanivorans]|uniref:Type VII secretion protein EccE n=1 Tax=Candidatus Mycolicibacterium alkanivorans TaxID=2954114 RepID=A0ABS9YTP4_9MYCO|nr:type VII secretion protein EccE [Candidatus Mycolicibacterium alkanivorans]MCI4674194.1 type VII secretion protein EccE [Candidatus Mycolicibacterium alkanivorans]
MRPQVVQLAVIVAVLLLGLIGWSVDGYLGAALGLLLGLVLFAVPWRRRPLWSWAALYLHRNKAIELSEPVTVANDRSGGGVRYQDGVAVVAVQLLGKAHTPTIFMGSTSTETRNTVDVSELLPAMHQSLGLTLKSLSVVSVGSRRRSTGDYPRVYDTLIGTPPYAGQRETWLVLRLGALENADALQWRTSVGTAALAAAQRVAAGLRCNGIRAKVATATDIVELERRLGRTALEPHNQRWRTARSDAGWLTTYAYQPRDINADVLAQAWSLRADGITQNITLLPDGTATATITVRSTQPPTAPPSVILKTLPGEQANAVAANMCGPRPELRGVSRGPLPASLILPIGPSGVLLGKIGAGDRLLLPMGDPGEFSRIHVAAEDAIAKRIVVRIAGAGDRITVHTRDLGRWESVRMPHVAVIDQPRPASGTTVSVVDGTVSPAPRPNTVIAIGGPTEPPRGSADVVITQTGPAIVEVNAAGRVYEVEVELFRAENRYVSSEPTSLWSTELEPVE